MCGHGALTSLLHLYVVVNLFSRWSTVCIRDVLGHWYSKLLQGTAVYPWPGPSIILDYSRVGERACGSCSLVLRSIEDATKQIVIRNSALLLVLSSGITKFKDSISLRELKRSCFC